MDDSVRLILASPVKHKQQVEQIVEIARRDPAVLAQVVDLLRSGSDVEKGTAAEVFKFVAADAPGMLLPHIQVLCEFIDHRAPRVRWGCPEAIGHLARAYPAEVEGAIPKLIANLQDKSTVVRWCAAFALAEIAKHNRERQGELLARFREWIETETNNGVRNVYAKAIKAIERQNP